MKTPAFRAGGWSPREGPPSHPAWGWPSPALAGRPQVGCLGLPAGLGGRGGTRPTWGTWRRLRSSEEPKVAPFSLQPDRPGPRGHTRAAFRGLPGARSPGALRPGALGPSLSAGDPGAPAAATRPRSSARRPLGFRATPPTLESFLAPRGGTEKELETDFAGAGFGAGRTWWVLQASRARSGVLGKGRQRRHSPGTWRRAGSRQIFVLGTACMALFLLMVWFVE